MKLQINAGALVAAADRAIPKLEAEIAARKPKPSWWDWIPSPVPPDFFLFVLHDRLKQAKLFRAIAAHKSPTALLEITDPELEGIAPYLSEFNDPNGRIE